MPWAIASAVIAAAGAVVEGVSESEAANAQKQIARQNAEIAARNADRAMATAESRQEALGMRNRAVAGSLKAKQGASGVRTDSGSSSEVQTSQRALGLFDQMMAKSNAAREAFGIKTQEKQFRDEAAIAKTRGSNALVGAGFDAASSLVSAASSASSSYSKWQDAAGSESDTIAGGGLGKGGGGADVIAVLAF